MWLQTDPMAHLMRRRYEHEWQRLAREAAPWPKVRADLARLFKGHRTAVRR